MPAGRAGNLHKVDSGRRAGYWTTTAWVQLNLCRSAGCRKCHVVDNVVELLWEPFEVLTEHEARDARHGLLGQMDAAYEIRWE